MIGCLASRFLKEDSCAFEPTNPTTQNPLGTISSVRTPDADHPMAEPNVGIQWMVAAPPRKQKGGQLYSSSHVLDESTTRGNAEDSKLYPCITLRIVLFGS